MKMLLLTLLLSLIVNEQYPMFCNAERLGEIDIKHYRDKVKQMFYHAYEGYLNHAYPYDELQPLTCQGHDTWGSYSLTLIDAMDTLAVLGNYSEFRRIAQILIDRGESFFDIDINASVFETNIRIVGGLLSGHLLMKRAGMVLEPAWPCSGPLLRMAENVARKILPAFDTPTGMPYGTVNLRHGVPKGETTVTCTAGVGTFIVEFGTLSRLTGDPIFEKTAIRAIRALWKYRSTLGLLGNHIDVSNGKWTALDSGIGGGIDSYFEYLVKGSIMFNIPELLHMFREYEVPITKYLKRGDWYMWAQMNKGSITLPLFTSLDAYWPGIQSLLGDVDEAMKTIHNFHQVWRQFGFTPEYYNIPKAEVHPGREGYPLRPELIESVMYLYQATKDPYLLEIGVDIVETIEHSTRTSCGYATVKDVRNHELEDRMESFFLAETTKYLYLLFDPDNFIHNNGSHGQVIDTPSGSCVIEAGGYVFNTEAHPIDLAAVHCCSAQKKEEDRLLQEFHNNLDILSLLNLPGESDDYAWIMPEEKETENINFNIIDKDIDLSDAVQGPEIPTEKTNIASTEESDGHLTGHGTGVKKGEGDIESIDHSQPESKHHLEVIDMTIFTEMERNLTHRFMQEQQMKSLLKALSTQVAQKMRDQYKATAYEGLANDVAWKILKAGVDLFSSDSLASDVQTETETSSDIKSEIKADSEDKTEEKKESHEAQTSTIVLTNADVKNEISVDLEVSKKETTNSVLSMLSDSKPDDLKSGDNNSPSKSSGSSTDQSPESRNVDVPIDFKTVDIKERATENLNSEVNTATGHGIVSSGQSEHETKTTNQNLGSEEHALNQQSDQGTTDMKEHPGSINQDSQIKVEVLSDGMVNNVIGHKVSVSGENKIVVIHLPKTEADEASVNKPLPSSEVTSSNSNAAGEEKTKPVDPSTERFKNHIDLEIECQDQKKASAESAQPAGASPPLDKPLTSLETKRSNILDLTTKILNMFSGSKEEVKKTEAKEEQQRTPSLAGLYQSLSNYTIRYFHDPTIMHCPAQSFHSKLSIYGEVFPEL